MNNRPSRPVTGRYSWVLVIFCLVAVFGSAATVWYALAPTPAPQALVQPEPQDLRQVAKLQPELPVADLDALKTSSQPRLAFSGEDMVGIDWLSNEEIVANLETVVFGSEFVGEDSNNIRKWVGPMRVAVYGDEAGQFSELVDSHLASLRNLTSLDIARVSEADPFRNAHILFLSRSQFNTYAQTYLARGKPGTNRNIACFGIFKSNKREIMEFHAMIPRSATQEEVRACIIEELTQVLGLPNDSFDIRPSIFNDDDEFHNLTWQDELFLRVLYDARVTPGMGRAAFEPVARAIVRELRPEGVDMIVAAKPPPAAVEPSLEVIPAAFPVTETPRLARDPGQQ
jgi:hypothetical protein